MSLFLYSKGSRDSEKKWKSREGELVMQVSLAKVQIRGGMSGEAKKKKKYKQVCTQKGGAGGVTLHGPIDCNSAHKYQLAALVHSKIQAYPQILLFKFLLSYKPAFLVILV